MDTRTALKKGTRLRIPIEGAFCREFEIRREIGRGAGCIVYDAWYRDQAAQLHAVRIKECCPYNLRIRREGQELVAEDEAAFAACKERLRQSQALHNRLFHTAGLTNSVTNTLEIYEANHTIYLVTAYAEGVTLTAEAETMTLKEKVTAAVSIAEAVDKIHAQGYLYLDLKPDNIFLLEETRELVQLYDFDSLLPMDFGRGEGRRQELRIICTPEFAAPELRLGRTGLLGKAADVYGVGAVLFYLIFGRPPMAPDCRRNAVWDFRKSCLAGISYTDRLIPALTEFFHRTLADDPGSRYENLRETADSLRALQRLADPEIPWIRSVRSAGSDRLFGREAEWRRLEKWFDDRASCCLFVTGIGGIGKSALVRSCLAAHAEDFDTVLYLYCTAPIAAMLADDHRVAVHTLQRREEEMVPDYFRRKLRKLKELTAGRRAVLVLDDFDSELDEDFRAVLEGEWKVLVLTRRERLAEGFDTLRIGRIRDNRCLYALFAEYAGMPELTESTLLTDEMAPTENIAQPDKGGEAGAAGEFWGSAERRYLDRIIAGVEGHTLALELIARQVAASYLTLESAAGLMEQKGFSAMAPETVVWRRDQVTGRDRIGHIISVLFHMDWLAGRQETLLKILALFDMPGIEVQLFADMLALGSKDGINALRDGGWIEYQAPYLRLHPVIRETVSQIPWSLDSREAACAVMQYLQIRLRDLLTVGENTGGKANGKDIRKGNVEDGGCSQRGAARASGSFRSLLLAEQVLRGSGRDDRLRESQAFRELLYAALRLAPREHEKFILTGGAWALEAAAGRSPEEILELCDRMVAIYDERQEFAAAGSILRQAEQYSAESDYLRARYEELLADYYDARLNGSYDEGESSEDYRKLLEANEKAIICMRKAYAAGHVGSARDLARYLLTELLLLIRGDRPEPALVDPQLQEYRELEKREIRAFTSEILIGSRIMYAWYYTWVCPEADLAEQYLKEAAETAAKHKVSGLDYLEQIIVPCANISLELNRYDEALEWLEQGLAICRQEEELEPYRRRAENLREYIRCVHEEKAAREGTPGNPECQSGML